MSPARRSPGQAKGEPRGKGTEGRVGETREPFPLILCAPTGTGKTTLARELLRRRDDVAFSISATTRPPRPGERDGVDYHFLSDAEFDEMCEAGELLEWAHVHQWRYGTPKGNLRRAQEQGRHLLLDIDVQGARQVTQAVPGALAVFLLPPSFDRLLERLHSRGSESEEERVRRMRTALTELEGAGAFEHVIVNDRLEDAIAALERILATGAAPGAGSREEMRRRTRDLLDSVRGYLGRPSR